MRGRMDFLCQSLLSSEVLRAKVVYIEFMCM